MTKLLDEAFEAVQQLPPADQDEIARAMLQFAQRDREPEEIDPAHLPAVREGLEQANRGEFATSAEVEAALRLFDL
jgi:predicted transcriptional regulator